MIIIDFILYLLGLKFWKASARKFYAIPDGNIAKKRKSEEAGLSSSLHATLHEIKEEVTALKAKVHQICEVTKDMPVPIGLKLLLRDSFVCKICHEAPMKKPPIFAKCCCSIIGCEPCIDEWYADGGLAKMCPACGTARGLSETVRVSGLDELLVGLREILDDQQ